MVQFYFDACGYLVFLTLFIEETLLIVYSLFPVKNQLNIYSGISLWTLFHWYMYLFLNCFNDCSLGIQFEIGKCGTSGFVLRIVLALQGLLWFHTSVTILFSISAKNAIEILIGVTLTLQMALGSISIFIIFILLIHMRHLSNCTFLNLFHQRVLVLISLTLLIKFILKYLTDFVSIIDGIYLFPLSDISLSVYRGTTEFCMLNLTSVT